MRRVVEIFEQIKNTNSINEKSRIITENKENKLFVDCLVFLLNKSIVTGISKKKYNKINVETSKWKHENITEEFLDLLEYIKKNNTGKDVDVKMCKSWCFDLNNEIQSFTESMITKSIKLGCDAKVVNKATPGLIPTFDVMLGTSIDKCKLKGNEWISLSRKLNGTRCAFIGDKCMTRQGKEYKDMDHIIDDLTRLNLRHVFVDGELLYKNEEGLSDSEAFQKGTGIAMSKDGDKSQLKFVIFDVFPLEEFWNGKSKDTYKVRKEELLCLKYDIKENNLKNIEVVPLLYEGTDHTEIWKWLDYAEENDYEGIMINLDTPYECKRTKKLIKVKKFLSCDIKCVGVEEGSGRNKGTLGALVCEYKNNKVNVGSGFTDYERHHFWKHPEDIIGKIVSVKYKEETKNKDGGVSIQFPVFETVRFDKNTESYN